ncbi:putative adenosine 3'-phospho 5'-phosphosulfate transporter 1 [Dictyocaulus viviparus]|uniref:Adenosine 3'-phospho 5'-phosphosulfate transporter 1 n=1 Tax=Dictyocaulus viviparus TaxID=29172 RepID=A0A0D8XYS8_DICVI|nr:putative adenosine 3'-phospho 5'-phosphosulfate transporter 1 [Dictyocaulus viviparus]
MQENACFSHFINNFIVIEALEPRTMLGRFLRSFAIGTENYQILISGKPSSDTERRNLLSDAITLMFFFTGIQCTLVMMGFLQERIITRGYLATEIAQIDKFGDAQFLVFCNRIVGILVCAIVLALTWKKQPPHAQPYYVHSYTSISNTMSTWCQYEALKYVSFPTQTICKTSKVVVTMLMGLVLRGQKYTWQEWACGGAVGLGAGLFLLGSGRSKHEGVVTSVSGMLLMLGYLVFDSYTLNYQKKLFDKKPKISKYQMMMGVNVFSAILCIVSLIEQGTLFTSIEFAFIHEGFFRDAFLLSLSGATGQLFIYSTIEKFGPIVFAVMMTIRQMLSILLSSFYYGHSLSSWSLIGFGIVFTAIFLDIYRRYFERRQSVKQ